MHRHNWEATPWGWKAITCEWKFQSFAVLSEDPVMMSCPSEEKATLFTHLLCPSWSPISSRPCVMWLSFFVKLVPALLTLLAPRCIFSPFLFAMITS